MEEVGIGSLGLVLRGAFGMIAVMPRAAFLTEFWRDVVSIGSLVVTIVGFGLTIIQLRKTKRAADAARKAADRASLEIRSDYLRYAISNVDRLFSEVSDFIINEDWSRATLRLGDLAHQIAQLIVNDTDWKVILTEVRGWQIHSRRMSGGGKLRFPSTRWAEFSVQILEKIDETYGPFKHLQSGGPR